MKKLIIICGLLLVALSSRATIINYSSGTLNTAITDGNAVGIFSSYTLSPAAEINSVSVTYDLSGGRAGDLVGYLMMVDGATTYSVNLINRPGVSLPSDPFGSGLDASSQNMSGVNVTGGMGVGSLSVGANTTWTLYLADLATGGGTAQLSSWGLTFDVTVVPEPATWALGIFGLLAGSTVVVRRWRTV